MIIQDLTTSAVIGEGAGTLQSLIVQPRPYNQGGAGGGTWQGIIAGTFPSGFAANGLFTYFQNANQKNCTIMITRLFCTHIQNANISAPDVSKEQVFECIKAKLDKPGSATYNGQFSNMRTREMEFYRDLDMTGSNIVFRDPFNIAQFPVWIPATKPTLQPSTQTLELVNDKFGTGPIQLGYLEYMEITTRFASPLGANTSRLVINFTMTKSYDY